MKRLISATVAAVGAGVVLTAVAGCGSDSSASVPTGADLKGTWSQSGAGFEKGVPVTWENQAVVIEKADGQGFAGFKEYTREGGKTQREAVNGVVGLDGNILFVDQDGKFEGRLIDGKLQGQYAEVGDDAAAINVEIVRS